MRKSILVYLLVAASSLSFAVDLYYVEDISKQLRKVNTTTLVSTTIGPTGAPGNFGDMAWDPTTSTMFFIGGRGDNNLYKLNLSTGAATLIGSHGVTDMFALGVDGSGQLYSQATSGAVYRMNKSNGSVSSIGSNAVYPGGYTWDSVNGRMIYLEAGGGRVFDVNLTNGAATQLANPGNTNDCDIAFDGIGNQYFAMDWSGNLFHYTAGFTRSTLGTGYGNVASVEIVPEPASLAVLGLGALALMRRRRR